MTMHNRPIVKDSTVLSSEYIAESFDQIAVMLSECCRVDSVAVAAAIAVAAVMLEIGAAASRRKGIRRLMSTAQRLIRGCEDAVAALPDDRRGEVDRALDSAVNAFDQFAGWLESRR